MKGKKRIVLCVLCILSVLVFAGCAGKEAAPETDPATTPESPAATVPSEPAATEASFIGAFTTSDLDGNPVTESILAEKEYTMINVWGTFCGPCINEMPELEEIHRNLPDNMQMIGVICDLTYGLEEESVREDAYKIIEETGVTYPSILITEDADWFYSTSNVVPTTYFVDSEGNLVSDIIYGAAIDDYKAAIEKLGS